MNITVGCCGFPMSKREYFEKFPIVEVQRTFYQLPRLNTAVNWRKEAPSSFTFTLKALQLITHTPSSPTYRRLRKPIPDEKKSAYGSFKNTAEVFQAFSETDAIAEALQAKVLVLQSPKSFVPTEDNKKNLISFFKKIGRRKYLLVWEPRGRWQISEITQICREHGIIHCTDPFYSLPEDIEIAYFRLHGKGGYRYRYSEKELSQLFDICLPYKEVLVLFNNSNMAEDALRFMEFINEKT
jgi:uncharacterized protein YecE (DUF72 family)